MDHPKFLSAPVSEAHIDDDRILRGLYFKDRTKKSLLKSSKALRLLSLTLHSMLIGVHLVLLGISATALEHRLTFSLNNQKMISLVITAISTTVGTIYSALLVFVTQTISVRYSLQKNQTLTATHDNAAAWAGIGSAVFHIWHQKAVPASLLGVLCTFLYLGNILVLHITTPALFSLETFTSYTSVPVGTDSLPAFNYTTFDSSVVENGNETVGILRGMEGYVTGSLYFLPSVLGSTTNLGLYDRTLYDVLDINNGAGNASVDATGFDISCGYVMDVDIQFIVEKDVWIGSFDGPGSYDFQILPTEWGIISMAKSGEGAVNNSLTSLLLYSTIPILDSTGTRGPRITLDPPMNYSVSTIQLVRCSLALVSQTAVVDTQSHRIRSVTPELNKSTSAWVPYTGNITTSRIEDILDIWGWLYSMLPPSDFNADTSQPGWFISIADLYLVQKFSLHNGSQSRSNVTLHELENSLSVVLAAMFWTLSHIAPTHGDFDSTSGFTYIREISNPFVLLRGNASVKNIFTQGRLDLNIIAVAAGLATSIALILLSLPSSLSRHGSKNDKDTTIDGTGILHAIWLYRNHPELGALLEQVEHPTDDNLREAGMVRTKLVGRRPQKQRGCDSL
ncbi:hypothetical protein DFH09DRAFT_1322719 [Mycena vulgaris]|nr:hypothetical protein DFH09DRAFT_1322719 [Mycena vulgaris]